MSARYRELWERGAPLSKLPTALTLFFSLIFFSFFLPFFFMGDGLRRRGRPACSLRLPKRLNRRENFVYLKLVMLVADYYMLICLYNKRSQSHQIWRKHHFLISSWFGLHFWRNFRGIKTGNIILSYEEIRLRVFLYLKIKSFLTPWKTLMVLESNFKVNVTSTKDIVVVGCNKHLL